MDLYLEMLLCGPVCLGPVKAQPLGFSEPQELFLIPSKEMLALQGLRLPFELLQSLQCGSGGLTLASGPPACSETGGRHLESHLSGRAVSEHVSHAWPREMRGCTCDPDPQGLPILD